MQKKNQLTMEDIKTVLNQDILIGSDSHSGKRFVFNPLHNELRIYVNDKYVDGGQDLEALLEDYNEIGDVFYQKGASKMTLSPNHVKEALDKDIMIGCDYSAGKTFIYNPQNNSYSILRSGQLIVRKDQAEDVLTEYNELN